MSLKYEDEATRHNDTVTKHLNLQCLLPGKANNIFSSGSVRNFFTQNIETMSKVKKQRTGLTIYQKLRIKEYASEDRTIRQVAEFVNADYTKTYQYIIKNNLPAKMNQFAKPRELHENSRLFVVGTGNWLL